MTIPEAFALGLQHHQNGRLAQAEAIYRQILAVDSEHADAWHLLGLLAHQGGRSDAAVEMILRAIALHPFAPAFHASLGQAYRKLGRPAEAVAAYRRALEMKPDFPEVHNNLGVALKEQGRIEEAIAAYRRAIQGRADFPEAHFNLANALKQQGQFAEAIAAYRRAMELQPGSAETHNNLGVALSGQERLGEATLAFRRALELKPDYAEAWNNLAVALMDQGRAGEAVASLRRAILLQPDYAEAHGNLGLALRNEGQLDEAIRVFRRMLALRPDTYDSHNGLANVLKDQGRLDEALAAYRRAVELRPDGAVLLSNVIYTLHFHPGQDCRMIAAEHDRWNRQFAAPLKDLLRPHQNDRDPERRLRVGYVSPDFWHHVICHFLTPLLEAHDPAQVEIYCYASVKRPDAITERLKKTAHGWRDVLRVPDEALAERIRADQIDILVDLTQHLADNRLPLFARKPAPVQVAWVGYPGSTGLETMDYRFTDARMEPEGSPWSESVEKAVRLPDSWFCFDPIDEFPVPGELPARRAGHVTFGCLNNFCKVNDAVLERWAKVLRAVEGSHLLLRCPEGETQTRVRQFFGSRGIGSERLELIGWTPTRGAFLDLFDRMDLVLDPFPYNGGTTTCEALWMGIPVLTLPGNVTVSRIGLSMLHAAGMSEFVAETEEDYVKLATGLAADLPRLAELRRTLRERMKASPFMDAPRFARAVENAYRQMWRAWCAQSCSPPKP